MYPDSIYIYTQSHTYAYVCVYNVTHSLFAQVKSCCMFLICVLIVYYRLLKSVVESCLMLHHTMLWCVVVHCVALWCAVTLLCRGCALRNFVTRGVLFFRLAAYSCCNLFSSQHWREFLIMYCTVYTAVQSLTNTEHQGTDP